MKLTAHLGYRCIRDCKRGIGRREFVKWMKYDEIVGFGSEFFDMLNALLCRTVAQPWMAKGYTARLDDYLTIQPVERPPDPRKFLAIFLALQSHQEQFLAQEADRGRNRRTHGGEA